MLYCTSEIRRVLATYCFLQLLADCCMYSASGGRGQLFRWYCRLPVKSSIVSYDRHWLLGLPPPSDVGSRTFCFVLDVEMRKQSGSPKKTNRSPPLQYTLPEQKHPAIYPGPPRLKSRCMGLLFMKYSEHF